LKDARIHKLRQWAERDLRISHTARTLIFRVFSERYVDSRHAADCEFFLPWTKIALWCGLSSKSQCKEVINELRRHDYLFDNGVRGCPPQRIFRLNLKLQLERFITADGIIPPPEPRKSPHPTKIRNNLKKLRAAAA
jgi:hypothetical protein